MDSHRVAQKLSVHSWEQVSESGQLPSNSPALAAFLCDLCALDCGSREVKALNRRDARMAASVRSCLIQNPSGILTLLSSDYQRQYS